MPSKKKVILSTRITPENDRRIRERLEGTGFSRAQFFEIAVGMILDKADMYEEIEFPVNEQRQIYVGDKLIMESGGASDPGMFLYGLTCLTKARGEK